MAQASENKVKHRLKVVSNKIVTVTPEMALRWLSCNPHNRQISEERVAKLCEKIRLGEWSPNPPVEVFDTGRLWNGQHRLTAIIRMQQTVPLRIVTLTKCFTPIIGKQKHDQ